MRCPFYYNNECKYDGLCVCKSNTMDQEKMVKEEILKVFSDCTPSEMALYINLNRDQLALCLDAIKPLDGLVDDEFMRSFVRVIIELSAMGLILEIRPR